MLYYIVKHKFQDHPNFSVTNNSSIQNNSITVCTTKNSDGTIMNSPVSKLPSIKEIGLLVKVEKRKHNLSVTDILFFQLHEPYYQH